MLFAEYHLAGGWTNSMRSIQVWAESLTALAYLIIGVSLALLWLGRRRYNGSHNWVILCLAATFVQCGVFHAMFAISFWTDIMPLIVFLSVPRGLTALFSALLLPWAVSRWLARVPADAFLADRPADLEGTVAELHAALGSLEIVKHERQVLIVERDRLRNTLDECLRIKAGASASNIFGGMAESLRVLPSEESQGRR